MAFVTGVVLGLMTFALVWRYTAQPNPLPGWYAFGWMLHGWLYVAYVAVGLDLVFRMKWALPKALLILLAGTIPFASFFAERWVTARVRPYLTTP